MNPSGHAFGGSSRCPDCHQCINQGVDVGAAEQVFRPGGRVVGETMTCLVIASSLTRARRRRCMSSSIGKVPSTHHWSPATSSSRCCWALMTGMGALAEQPRGDLLDLSAHSLCVRVGFEQAQLQPEGEQVEPFGLLVVVPLRARQPRQVGDGFFGLLRGQVRPGGFNGEGLHPARLTTSGMSIPVSSIAIAIAIAAAGLRPRNHRGRTARTRSGR